MVALVQSRLVHGTVQTSLASAQPRALLGCTSLKGRAATQRSKKGSEKVLGRVLGMVSGEGFWGGVLVCV